MELYIVATPIGNLEDITYRAVRVLQEVDMVLCEDTRVTKHLLDRYEIITPTLSYHANSKLSRTEKILEMIQEGKTLALVSDAGTPTISDPGVQLIQLIHERGIDVEIISIPGPSAITAALSVAGLAGNQFTFYGFIPHKKGRKTLFEELAASTRAAVFYESPHRLEKTLNALALVLDEEREVVVAKELTKIHEQVIRGTSKEVVEFFKTHPDKIKGEFVVMVAGT